MPKYPEARLQPGAFRHNGPVIIGMACKAMSNAGVGQSDLRIFQDDAAANTTGLEMKEHIKYTVAQWITVEGAEV